MHSLVSEDDGSVSTAPPLACGPTFSLDAGIPSRRPTRVTAHLGARLETAGRLFFDGRTGCEKPPRYCVSPSPRHFFGLVLPFWRLSGRALALFRAVAPVLEF